MIEFSGPLSEIQLVEHLEMSPHKKVWTTNAVTCEKLDLGLMHNSYTKVMFEWNKEDSIMFTMANILEVSVFFLLMQRVFTFNCPFGATRITWEDSFN